MRHRRGAGGFVSVPSIEGTRIALIRPGERGIDEIVGDYQIVTSDEIFTMVAPCDAGAAA